MYQWVVEAVSTYDAPCKAADRVDQPLVWGYAIVPYICTSGAYYYKSPLGVFFTRKDIVPTLSCPHDLNTSLYCLHARVLPCY